MQEYEIGPFIIEILTEGMYSDPYVLFREYIQNSCDQIDEGEKKGILRPRNVNSANRDLGEGEINIWITSKDRTIEISDNATGIKHNEFEKIMKTIAGSKKIIGEQKGFRGIGRLIGLPLCDKLQFSTRYAGEDVVSTMTWDAKKLKQLINGDCSVQEVLEQTTSFEKRVASNDDYNHFFKVELFNVDKNKQINSIFENETNLIDYLSFVAPVPYANKFIYSSEIYNFALEHNFKIDEYLIKVNGHQIFKEYRSRVKAGGTTDEITGIIFKLFKNKNDIIAWGWYQQSCYSGAIDEHELSKYIRLRKENIQIGDKKVLNKFHTKEQTQRGAGYFLGEIFAISKDLIPNSHRSDFNTNPTFQIFQKELTNFFNNELYLLYRLGSDISSNQKKINIFNKNNEKFENDLKNGKFNTPNEIEKARQDLDEQKIKAQEAEKELTKIVKKHPSATKILQHKQQNTDPPKETKKCDNKNKKVNKIKLLSNQDTSLSKKQQKFMSAILDKVFDIINNSTDKKTAEHLIEAIKDHIHDKTKNSTS